MFVKYDKKTQRVPIKVWLPDMDHVEPGCWEQALHLSNLPFVDRPVALMPDTHQGYGMPIGGVLATHGVIIPNCVGIDIGCGMGMVHTNIPASLLHEVQAPDGSLAQQIVGAIMRTIPVGFAHHKEPQRSEVLDSFQKEHAPSLGRPDHHIFYPSELMVEIEEGYYQLATLGSGNHFIELQEDEDGKLGIMLHSGSRNFGLKIARYFNDVAKKLNKRQSSEVPSAWDLAYLPAEAPEGKAYIQWMNLALDFARENRKIMMERTKEIVFDLVERHAGFKGIEVDMEVNAHHNYAALERHGGEDLWVHRKGAIRAQEGEIGIIPGAMGSYSYIVRGRGNPESYYSCSHGAGRKMGRKEATRRFSVQEVMDDFKAGGVVLGKSNKKDVAEEYWKAYKDIDFVIDNERDLVQPIMKLKTVAVVKG